MTYCHGTNGVAQAVCGTTKAHVEHEFTASICPGAPAGFEADCGKAGPHLEHEYEADL